MDHGRKGFGSGFALGAIVGSLAAVFLYANRRELSAAFWKIKAKADIERRLRNLKEVSREAYEEIVDQVLARYRSAKNAAAYEIDEFSSELKGRYEEVRRRFERAARAFMDDEE